MITTTLTICHRSIRFIGNRGNIIHDFQFQKNSVKNVIESDLTRSRPKCKLGLKFVCRPSNYQLNANRYNVQIYGPKYVKFIFYILEEIKNMQHPSLEFLFNFFKGLKHFVIFRLDLRKLVNCQKQLGIKPKHFLIMLQLEWRLCYPQHWLDFVYPTTLSCEGVNTQPCLRYTWQLSAFTFPRSAFICLMKDRVLWSDIWHPS